MAEYEEQMRRAEEQLKGEDAPRETAPAETPEDVLRRAEETLQRTEEAPAQTETAEEIRARLERELGLEKPKPKVEVEEKPGKLSPELRSELESKVSAYEKMITNEEADIERVKKNLDLSAAAAGGLGKHLPQMRETLRQLKDELRRDDERKEGLTP